MRELDIIIAEYESLKSKNIGAILATVVLVEGSSYRRAGARMLIDEYGSITGAISGGCLEGDALKKALHALHQQKNKLITYDTSDEDDAIIGAQLGCNGIIQVLFEPLSYEDIFNACELLKTVIAQKHPLAIVVQFNLDSSKYQAGTVLTIHSNLEFRGKQMQEDLLAFSLEKAALTFKTKTSNFIKIKSEIETQNLFIQYYTPPVKLIIVGAGNDAQILAQQADLLGWEVIVTDGRPTHANKDRFTSSCQIIVANPEQTLEHIEIDQRSYVVLMSHNYNYDFEVLKLLISEVQIPYIGILGPLTKYQRMEQDLKNEGFNLTEIIRNKIHAPIGLEIGAETPSEIGLSILSEIQSVVTKTSARPLREKLKPIHEQSVHFITDTM